MATYPQLQAELWWGAEFEPPNLAKLNRDLRAFFHTDALHIGSKGDYRHLSGYHRSRAWLQNSIYCTNRSYSIKETNGNAFGGNSNWLAAIDFQPPTSQQLYDACRRLDAAVRAGRLEKITQWFGSFDGNTVVGYDNVNNRPDTSDSSHLWHLHLSFDRGRVGEDHTDLFAVLIGEDMTPEESAQLKSVYDFTIAMGYRIDAITFGRDQSGGGPYAGEGQWLVQQVKALTAKVDALAVASGVDPAALKAAVQQAIQAETPAIADAVADEEHARSAE